MLTATVSSGPAPGPYPGAPGPYLWAGLTPGEEDATTNVGCDPLERRRRTTWECVAALKRNKVLKRSG